jgi:hypothetical protein
VNALVVDIQVSRVVGIDGIWLQIGNERLYSLREIQGGNLVAPVVGEAKEGWRVDAQYLGCSLGSGFARLDIGVAQIGPTVRVPAGNAIS